MGLINSRFLYVIISLCLLNIACFGQSKSINFEHLTIDQGLSQNSINSIAQDSLGFMWFGTQDGLNRYDGYQFKIYKHIPEDSTSFPSSNWAEVLSLDHQGNLWIGTRTGLCRFDAKKEHFVHYDFEQELVVHTRINAILATPEGDLWIGSNQGLSKMKYQDGKMTAIQHFDPALLGAESVHVNTIFQDDEGNVWIGTKIQGLFKFEKGNIESQEVPIYQGERIGGILSHSNVTALVQDEAHHIWVGTQKGLDVISLDGTVQQRYRHDTKTASSLSEDWVVDLFKDSRGQIWVGTYAFGLCQYLPETNNFKRHQQEVADPFSLNDNNIIKAIYEDQTGILWVGTLLGGVNYYDVTRMKFPHFMETEEAGKGLNDHVMRAFYKDTDSMIWIGSQNGGLNCLDTRTGKFSYFRHNPTDENSIASDYVKTVTKDKTGKVWVGTRRAGISVIDFSSTQPNVKHYRHDPQDKNSLSFNQISNIATDKEGGVWVIDYQGTLSKYRPETDDFDQKFKGFLDDNRGLCLHIDQKGLIWVGCIKWLKEFDPSTGDVKTYRYDAEVKNGLPKGNIKSIFQGSNNEMWIGSSVGLLRLDLATDAFSLKTTSDGLPNNMVYAALEDRNGDVWMSTNRGISQYNPKEGSFKNYDTSDGLQSNEFNTGAYHFAWDGQLIFGGINGFNAFWPSDIQDNPHAPTLVFTDFQLFSKQVPIRDAAHPNSPLTQSISTTNSLSLSYRDYVMLLEFSALHYSNSGKNNYAYKLEPFETEWNYTNSNRRAITYTNLPPKDYVFKVKVSNNDNVWNEEGIELQITVSPPWYEIVWVQLLFLLALILGVYTMYKVRINAVKRQQVLLEKKVVERTREVREKNEQLEKKQEEITAQRDNLEASYQNVRVMSDIGQQITRLLDQRSLIKLLYERVNSLMDAAGFGVGLIKDDQLEFVNFIERNKSYPDFTIALSDKNKMAVWCIDHQQPVFINDIDTEYNKYASGTPKKLEGEMPNSLIYVPLVFEQKVIGVTTVQSFSKNAYTEYHLTLLQNLATFIAIALTNAKTYYHLDEIKKQIEHKNLAMLDSIRYAETIQNAILPTQLEVKEYFKETFIFYKPKDIVSGDFYWFSQKDQFKYVAVVDCTGHGVPGAFMSIIGNSLLTEIINKHPNITPSKILYYLNQAVKNVLRQQKAKNADGMDICLCRLDEQKGELLFAGAKRPLWYVANGEMKELKGDNKSIGGYHKDKNVEFNDQLVRLNGQMMLYLTSDGMADQNNEARKKIGSKQLKEYLQLIADKPAEEQKNSLARFLENHQGSAEQRDDIAIIGIQIALPR